MRQVQLTAAGLGMSLANDKPGKIKLGAVQVDGEQLVALDELRGPMKVYTGDDCTADVESFELESGNDGRKSLTLNLRKRLEPDSLLAARELQWDAHPEVIAAIIADCGKGAKTEDIRESIEQALRFEVSIEPLQPSFEDAVAAVREPLEEMKRDAEEGGYGVSIKVGHGPEQVIAGVPQEGKRDESVH